MAEIDAAPVAGVTSSESSFAQRLIGVLTEPGRILEEVARQPDFIRPLALLMSISVAVTEIILSRVGIHQIVRTALMQNGQAAQLGPEQLEQAIARGASIYNLIAHLNGVLGVPILLAAASGVGLIILNGVFGLHVSFRKVFSVACYADLPGVLGGLMAMAVILFGDPNAFNPQAPAPTNPGFFLNPLETSRPVYALASSLDVFILWFLVLLAMGLARVSEGKVKSRSIFLIYFGIWMSLILAKVGFALFA